MQWDGPCWRRRPSGLIVKQRLEKSPRHHEWVVVKNGQRDVHCFVVFPEVKNKATSVIVIHENKGLTDWVRGVADQLAEAGYIAIAPDMLSGMGPKAGKTSDFPSEDAARTALGGLSKKPEQVTGDLNAAADYIVKVPGSNGKLAVCGFCWGGGQTFRFATNRGDLKGAFVFYGMFDMNRDNLGKINCPVYGFYAENDGHGFMRAGEDPAGSADNRKARTDAWERFRGLLKKL
ncbi:MAG: dienelactone hydrolase family protein [Gemmataceae bacterium]|nr:dienelactone hydrolase family protein [Gemmataceae bacterium]MCI0740589.1 dienelactone hydrolase family protein [Gemmataceae bacterium]